MYLCICIFFCSLLCLCVSFLSVSLPHSFSVSLFAAPISLSISLTPWLLFLLISTPSWLPLLSESTLVATWSQSPCLPTLLSTFLSASHLHQCSCPGTPSPLWLKTQMLTLSFTGLLSALVLSTEYTFTFFLKKMPINCSRPTSSNSSFKKSFQPAPAAKAPLSPSGLPSLCLSLRPTQTT